MNKQILQIILCVSLINNLCFSAQNYQPRIELSEENFSAQKAKENNVALNPKNELYFRSDGKSLNYNLINKVYEFVYAAQNGDKDTVQKYIKEGLDINSLTFTTNESQEYIGPEKDIYHFYKRVKCSALNQAIQNDQKEIIQMLLKNGAKVLLTDGNNESALHVAMDLGNYELFVELTEQAIKENNNKLDCNVTQDVLKQIAIDAPQNEKIEQLRKRIAFHLLKNGVNHQFADGTILNCYNTQFDRRPIFLTLLKKLEKSNNLL